MAGVWTFSTSPAPLAPTHSASDAMPQVLCSMTPPHARPPAPSDRQATAPTTRLRGRVFRREGEYWTIVFESRLIRLRDGKGLRYLAHLLSHPAEPIRCEDLHSIASWQTSQSARSAERTRVAVTKRIKASVAKIAALHPALAVHLAARVRTGYTCVYLDDAGRRVSWRP